MIISNSLQSPINDSLINQIIKHEKKVPYAYQDSLGYWTIGAGRLIDKRKGGKLSDDEIIYLLNNDLKNSEQELKKFSWYNNLDAVRQGVMIELNFNMGLENLLGFKNMLSYIAGHDFVNADKHLKNSLYAKQVKDIRINDLSYRLINGKYP